MNDKSDFNKIVYIIIAVLFVVIIFIAVSVALKNNRELKNNEEESTIVFETVTEKEVSTNEAQISEIKEGNLPSLQELSEAGLENVMQTSKINQQFNLYNYEIKDGEIIYSYLANAVTNGERLYVRAKQMTEDEYNNMLPANDVQTGNIDNVTVVFNNRNVYYVREGLDLPEYIKKSVDDGKIVVRYDDNSIGELLPMQQMMWYNNGIGYTLESIRRSYNYEDMLKLTEDFFNASK